MKQQPGAAGAVHAASVAEPACPACGGVQIERFFDVPELPVNCIALWKTREEAMRCSRGRIDLGLCVACGAVSNLAFDAARLSYDASYDNSLHFSATFQRYADEVARALVDRYDLHGKDVIDVGCGNGEFLASVCAIGGNRGVGFDPSFIPGRADAAAGLGITIVRDYYSEQHAGYAADLIMCRHVLEHIAEPQRFLRSVRAALGNRSGAAVFFEVPNAAFTFRNNGIWDIIYEHCFYYTAGSLARLFAACGFDVLDVSERFHGQYLCLEARPSAGTTGQVSAAHADLGSLREDVSRFAGRYRASREGWDAMLRRAAGEGRRVVPWAAGAKGAMFLNAFRDFPGLEYIVDVNPHKCGLHVPGTGQRVVPPAFLQEYRPDVLLVMNPVYRDEIARQVAALGLQPELIAI